MPTPFDGPSFQFVTSATINEADIGAIATKAHFVRDPVIPQLFSSV